MKVITIKVGVNSDLNNNNLCKDVKDSFEFMMDDLMTKGSIEDYELNPSDISVEPPTEDNRQKTKGEYKIGSGKVYLGDGTLTD